MSSASKDSNPKGTSALSLIKVALGLDVDARMHNQRRTLEQRWSFHQANVMCFVDFAPYGG